MDLNKNHIIFRGYLSSIFSLLFIAILALSHSEVNVEMKKTIRPGNRFQKGGVAYQILELLPNHVLLIKNLGLQSKEEWGLEDIWDGVETGELKFERKGKNTKKRNLGDLFSTEYRIGDFSNLEDRKKLVARRRHQVVEVLLRAGAKNRNDRILNRYADLKFEEWLRKSSEMTSSEKRELRNLRTNNKKLPELFSISNRSMRRWLTAYVESGFDIRALVNDNENRGGKGIPRTDKFIEQHINLAIQEYYLTEDRYDVPRVYNKLLKAINDDLEFMSTKYEYPGISTLYRRIDEIDPKIKYEKRFGRKYAERRNKTSRQGVRPDYPYERLELDGTILDIFVVDHINRLPIGRPTLIVARCALTKYPAGFYLGFQPESWATVSDCLYHSINRKPDFRELYNTEHEWLAFGMIDSFVGDNRWWNTKLSMEDVSKSLGFFQNITTPYKPWENGGAESFIKTIQTDAVHIGPGTSYGNIIQKADYDAIGNAVVTEKALFELLTIYFVDVYAQSPHGKRNVRPADLWEERMAKGHWPAPPPDIGDLRVLLGRLDHRTIHAYGIDFNNIRYQNHEELQPLYLAMKEKKRHHRITNLQAEQGKKLETEFKIKVNPNNLGSIHVYDHIFTKKYIEVKAELEYSDYVEGLSEWGHKKIQNYNNRQLNQKNNLASLVEAKAKIHEIYAREFEVTNKIKTRSRSYRVIQEIPQNEIKEDIKHPYANVSIPQYESTNFQDGSDEDWNTYEDDNEDWEGSYDHP